MHSWFCLSLIYVIQLTIVKLLRDTKSILEPHLKNKKVLKYQLQSHIFYFLSGEANHVAKKIKDFLCTLCYLTFSQSGSRPERLEEALRRGWDGKQVCPGHAEEVLRKHK